MFPSYHPYHDVPSEGRDVQGAVTAGPVVRRDLRPLVELVGLGLGLGLGLGSAAGLASGLGLGFRSTSVCGWSKAAWHVSETALKPSEMLRCLNWLGLG